MVVLPAAIILVNNDISANVQAMLVRQLFIDEVLDGYVFDDRVTADSDYPNLVKRQQRRLLVVRSFEELNNRTNMDVVIFFKNGLVSVLQNNFGPPVATFLVINLAWGKLGVY